VRVNRTVQGSAIMRKKALLYSLLMLLIGTRYIYTYIFNMDIFYDDVIHIGIMMIIVQLI